MAVGTRIQVILTPEQAEALQLHAKNQKRSTSNMGSTIIEEWLEAHPHAASTKAELLAASIQRTYGFDDQKMDLIRPFL